MYLELISFRLSFKNANDYTSLVDGGSLKRGYLILDDPFSFKCVIHDSWTVLAVVAADLD